MNNSPKKRFIDLTAEEMEKLFQEAAREEIAEHHAAGRPTTHGDAKGVYKLYPDGKKEYIELYETHKNGNDHYFKTGPRITSFAKKHSCSSYFYTSGQRKNPA